MRGSAGELQGGVQMFFRWPLLNMTCQSQGDGVWLRGFYAAEAIMAEPSTPGPGWSFELLMGTLMAALLAAAVLVPHVHLKLGWHMSHGGRAAQSKSL